MEAERGFGARQQHQGTAPRLSPCRIEKSSGNWKPRSFLQTLKGSCNGLGGESCREPALSKFPQQRGLQASYLLGMVEVGPTLGCPTCCEGLACSPSPCCLPPAGALNLSWRLEEPTLHSEQKSPGQGSNWPGLGQAPFSEPILEAKRRSHH